jgi:hypothetical protein
MKTYKHSGLGPLIFWTDNIHNLGKNPFYISYKNDSLHIRGRKGEILLENTDKKTISRILQWYGVKSKHIQELIEKEEFKVKISYEVTMEI